MILYKIGGLGADYRVFEKLTLNAESQAIEWIAPIGSESLADYALRILDQIDQNQNFGIIGVSFGGLLAIELGKICRPKTIILVSSVSDSSQLPLHILKPGLSRLINLIPNALMRPPQFIMNFMFGAVDRSLLKKIIADTDPKFIKWALHKLLIWKSKASSSKYIRIHGDQDRLIPLRGSAKLIKGGTHFMIVDKADEISDVINEHLQSLVTS